MSNPATSPRTRSNDSLPTGAVDLPNSPTVLVSVFQVPASPLLGLLALAGGRLTKGPEMQDPMEGMEFEVADAEQKASNTAALVDKMSAEFTSLWGRSHGPTKRAKETRRRRAKLRQLLTDLMGIVKRSTAETEKRCKQYREEAGLPPSEPDSADPYEVTIPAEWPLSVRWWESCKVLARAWDHAAYALREENR